MSGKGAGVDLGAMLKVSPWQNFILIRGMQGFA